ncbi:hypothetical protein [Ascidiimonas aurantiaca]|uniref:hypothetical protein n=1 Tax=Ascidiimonas aurantiaca TaxID=1685432 RepID=UPI0030EB8068
MRNIRSLFFIFFSTLLVNCGADDDVSTQEFQETLNVRVGTSDFYIGEGEDDHLITGNTNCNKIFIHTLLKNEEKEYRLSFELLKNGELKKVECWEASENLTPFKLYLTPNFKPASSVEITNFSYAPATNDIRFGFEGTLYLENEVNTSKTKEISGFIELNSFRSIDCALTYLQSIEYNSSSFKFNSIYTSRMEYPETLLTDYQFVSNNGYILNLISENDLWEMPIGTYNFDMTSSINKVTLKEYKGSLLATQAGLYNEEDWELLDVSGHFTIDNKEESGIERKTSGKINVNVSLHDQLLFNISDMEYHTTSYK